MKSTKHPLLTSIILTLFIFVIGISQADAQSKPDPRQTTSKFATLLNLINYYYVDTANQAELTEKAIVALLKELDPHSVYISKEDVRKANEPLQGNFDGIGVQFQIFHDTILIVGVVPGGPSEQLGILNGDKIIRIDGVDAFGPKVDNDFVMNRLRGPRGTKVDVSIFRKGNRELIDYTITRDKIPLNSIDAYFMIDPAIGYIRLSRFARSSMDEMRDAMTRLRKQGMQSLILDLRNNTGGYLDVAFELADEFLPEKKLIVYTEGLHSPRANLMSTREGSSEKGKLVVMINEGSASASEIVAGAIQDWDRGILVGRRSFGKGLVQRPFNLPDSSMVRLTISKYYTPSGRNIQKPYDTGVEDYYADLQNRFKHGEFVTADSIKFPDSIKYYTASRRVVYGGGGIMPDVFIPRDTTSGSKYMGEINRKGLINEFSNDYMEDNRAALTKKYPTLKSLREDLDFRKRLLDEFVAYAEKKGVKRDEDGLKRSGQDIEYVLLAMVARNLFDWNAYYELVTPIDNELLRAVEVMRDDKLFRSFNISD